MVNFNEEKKLWKQGFKYVAGLDEAGRGPLAGPVVAAAVSVRQFTIHNTQFTKINDSKKLSEKQREEFYELLINHPDISWGVGIVSERVIDKINILEASKLAMQKALENLKVPDTTNLEASKFVVSTRKIDFLLIDGNFKLATDIPQLSIIKGDSKVFSIAAASIIAKVTRDRLMQKMHKKYPHYDFARHKGYGTAAHLAALKTHGPCQIHRKTFWPVSSYV